MKKIQIKSGIEMSLPGDTSDSLMDEISQLVFQKKGEKVFDTFPCAKISMDSMLTEDVYKEMMQSEMNHMARPSLYLVGKSKEISLRNVDICVGTKNVKIRGMICQEESIEVRIWELNGKENVFVIFGEWECEISDDMQSNLAFKVTCPQVSKCIPSNFLTMYQIQEQIEVYNFQKNWMQSFEILHDKPCTFILICQEKIFHVKISLDMICISDFKSPFFSLNKKKVTPRTYLHRSLSRNSIHHEREKEMKNILQYQYQCSKGDVLNTSLNVKHSINLIHYDCQKGYTFLNGIGVVFALKDSASEKEISNVTRCICYPNQFLLPHSTIISIPLGNKSKIVKNMRDFCDLVLEHIGTDNTKRDIPFWSQVETNDTEEEINAFTLLIEHYNSFLILLPESWYILLPGNLSVSKLIWNPNLNYFRGYLSSGSNCWESREFEIIAKQFIMITYHCTINKHICGLIINHYDDDMYSRNEKKSLILKSRRCKEDNRDIRLRIFNFIVPFIDKSKWNTLHELKNQNIIHNMSSMNAQFNFNKNKKFHKNDTGVTLLSCTYDASFAKPFTLTIFSSEKHKRMAQHILQTFTLSCDGPGKGSVRLSKHLPGWNSLYMQSLSVAKDKITIRVKVYRASVASLVSEIQSFGFDYPEKPEKGQNEDFFDGIVDIFVNFDKNVMIIQELVKDFSFKFCLTTGTLVKFSSKLIKVPKYLKGDHHYQNPVQFADVRIESEISR